MPKFKTKWVNSQEKKGSYRQMFMEESRTLESDISIAENDRSNESATQQVKKQVFMSLTPMKMSPKKMI